MSFSRVELLAWVKSSKRQFPNDDFKRVRLKFAEYN